MHKVYLHDAHERAILLSSLGSVGLGMTFIHDVNVVLVAILVNELTLAQVQLFVVPTLPQPFSIGG